MTPRRWLLVFVSIVVLAAVLRWWQLGQVPSSLYWDEVAMLVDAKSVAQTGHDMHGRPWFQLLYPSYGDYKLPVYLWLASASVSLLGVSEWALRLPSTLAGIATVVLAGLIARQLWTNARWAERSQLGDSSAANIVQAAAMFIVAVSPWSILFSRTAFEGHLAQSLVALSLWLWLSKPHWLWRLVAAAVAALATYTYFSVRFVWPVVLVGAAGLESWPLFWQWLTGKQALSLKRTGWWVVSQLVLPLVTFSVLLLPMLNSPLYADSNRFRLGTDSVLKNETEILTSNLYREVVGNTPIDRVLFHRSWLTTRELLKNYADHFNLTYLFVTGDPNLRHGTGFFGLFSVVWLPFLLLGLVALWQWRPRVLLLLLGWWLAAVLPAAVPENTPHALRSLNALVPLAIVIAFGIVLCRKWWIDRQKSLLSKISRLSNSLLICVIGLLVMAQVPFLYHYFRWYDQDSALAWQDGYREVAQALVAHRTANQPVVVLSFDDKFFLWVMAYGPYTGEQFQSWQSREFLFSQFDGIDFAGHNLASCAESCLLVGRVDRVAQTLQQIAGNQLDQYQIISYPVTGRVPASSFVVADVKKN